MRLIEKSNANIILEAIYNKSDSEDFESIVDRDFNLFLQDKYGVKDDEDMKNVLNNVSEEDVNEYFSSLFYDIVDYDDLDSANDAEDIIRNKYLTESTKTKKDKKPEERIIMQQGNVTCLKKDNKFKVFEDDEANLVEYDNQEEAMRDLLNRCGVNPDNELKDEKEKLKESANIRLMQLLLKKEELRTDETVSDDEYDDKCELIDNLIINEFDVNEIEEAEEELKKQGKLTEQVDEGTLDDILAYMYDESDGVDENIPTFEDIFEDYTDEITKQQYNKLYDELKSTLSNIKYYFDDNRQFIELNDNHILYNIDENSKADEEDYNMIVNSKCKSFKEETGEDLYLLGRSGRHVCIEDNTHNALNYDKFVKIQERLEQEAINEINSIK